MNKIIFWISADLLPFCLAYFLQKNYNGEFYSITDISNNPRKFFEEQEFVNFSKNWFYHDYMAINKEVDLEYIENFQKKYNIDLNELANNDRILNKYNPYYDFSKDEINSILENECKLFEMILDEANPDYLITGQTHLRPHHLFHEMCKQKGIKILMLNHANWKTFCYISQNRHKIDYIKKIGDEEYDECSFEFLQNLWEKSKVSKHHSKFHSQIKNSKISLFKAAMKYLFSSNENIKTHYTYFGRHKLKILYNELQNSRIKKQRQQFIDLNLLQNFENSNTPFVL